jgi:hypothetical protein
MFISKLPAGLKTIAPENQTFKRRSLMAPESLARNAGFIRQDAKSCRWLPDESLTMQLERVFNHGWTRMNTDTK